MSVGFPDWGRQAPVAGQQKFKINQAITTPYVSGILYIGDYGAVSVTYNADDLSNHYFIEVFWIADVNGDQYLVESSFTTQSGGAGSMILPVLGPFMQVKITNIEATSDGDLVAYVYGTNAAHGSARDSQFGKPLCTFDGTVGAGATQNADSTSISQGAGTLHIYHGNNSTWTCTLSYFSHETAAWKRYAFINGADYGLSFTGRVNVPPAPVRLGLTNADTSSRTMVGSLVVD
jgi:hypothetical protein